MKRLIVLLALLINGMCTTAQEHEQQLEMLAEREEAIVEDDQHWQQLQQWQEHPLNLNSATEDELQALQLLTAIQIHYFLQYRKMLGELIDKYELQAIPGWDIPVIKRLLPYVTISASASLIEHFRTRLFNGEQKLLIRVGNKPIEPEYPGSGLALMTRYVYKFKNLLQYGVTADKDAGEEFLKGSNKAGFDFYSFHFFSRNHGKIKALALGDFTVRLGQGLIQWQGLAFKKSSSILATKRQAPVLQPYNSPGEYNFYRGAGVTVQRDHIELTAFASFRKFDATVDNKAISSVISSGYHRTQLEMARKNNIQCLTLGGSVQWRGSQAHIGLNSVHHQFSDPFETSGKPYDQFNATGRAYNNVSVDYGYTFRNVHVFGEIAVDKSLNQANLHGLLASLHPQVDIALLYRSISRSYQSFFSNAFTENSLPVNEKGCYLGMVLRPATGLQLDVYADFFQFPWLKYQVDAPSRGQEYLIQLTVAPTRNVELYTRFRLENKALLRKNWRTQIVYKLNRTLQTRTRLEAVLIGKNQQSGFLFFHDIQYKPAFKAFSCNARVQYVETDGYDSRLYAMEHLVQYSFSAPAFYNKGWRGIISANCKMKFNQSISCSINLALIQTINPSKAAAAILDNENQRTLTFQCIISRLKR